MDHPVQDRMCQIEVTNIWSQPLSEIRIDWEDPAMERPLGNQIAHRKVREEQGSSLDGSHSFFSVITLRLFHRHIHFFVHSS